MRALDLYEKLTNNLHKDIEATSKSKITVKSYDNPNWAYRQADVNGYLRALNNVLKFVEEYKKQKDKEREEKIDRIIDEPTREPLARPYTKLP